jgi:hypothetical protein
VGSGSSRPDFPNGLQGAPSVTHGVVGAEAPAYMGAPVSLAFQGKGSMSCIGGSMEL